VGLHPERLSKLRKRKKRAAAAPAAVLPSCRLEQALPEKRKPYEAAFHEMRKYQKKNTPHLSVRGVPYLNSQVSF
jgi:hypothetical protein